MGLAELKTVAFGTNGAVVVPALHHRIVLLDETIALVFNLDSVIGAKSVEWQGLALSINPMFKASVDLLVTTFASIEHRAPFICTSQLQCVISHLLPSTFRTGLLYRSVGLNISRSEGLHRRSFGPQRRGKSRRLGLCGDSLR